MEQAGRKKAVFLDVDGTLIMRRLGPHKDDLDAMEEAARKGHYIFLNTGRSFANIQKVLLEIDFLKGIVAGCGAHVLFRNGADYQTVYSQSIPDEMIKKIINWYKKHGRCCIFEGQSNCYVINRTTWPGIGEHTITINSYDDIQEKSPGDLITKITLEGTATEEEQLFLKPHFDLYCLPHYSEVIIKGESKDKAMGIALKKLGLRQEDSVAVGDSANDLGMLLSAGIGIAMGNAPQEIKAAADAVTEDFGKGGVAQALIKFVLNKNT